MKKNLLVCMLALFFMGLLFTYPKGVTAQAEEVQKAEVLVAEELTWTSANAGWGDVKKNKLWNDAPIVVNGVDYSYNSIGTHIPLGVENNADIVYDISEYSSQYEWFEVMVAQPDSGNNMCHFQVLVDDVLVDDIYWRKSGDANLSESVHTFSYNPVWMRANIKGASKLTLRAKESGYGQGDGVCAWIHPRLYNEGEVRVYASDVLQRVKNASTTGWDYGHGNVAILDGKANGNSLFFEGTLQRYEKGIGVQLKGSNYADYAANKNDTNLYVSLKYDIANKGYTLFNTLVEMDLSFGCYVDFWIDGEEVYHSDLINSNGTLAYNGQWLALAPQVLNVAIPENASIFEVRIIPENGIGDGLINLCNAAFYKQNEYLYTMYADEMYASVYPFEVTRGRDAFGNVTQMRVGTTSEDRYYDNGIYMPAGDNINTPACYSYDIKGLEYNSFSSTIGLASSNGDSAQPVTFCADIVYADGSKKTYRSELITWTNSGKEFTFAYDNTNAEKLNLYVVADDAAYTESVWGDAKLANKLIANYFVNGSAYKTYSYDPNEVLVKPENPVVEGYEFKYWAYNDEEFNFENQEITQNMVFTAVLEAKTYDITYKQSLDNVLSDATYEPLSYKYGTTINVPTANIVEGYTFEGWYLNGQLVEGSLTNQLGNIELVAKYTINEYTVKFIDDEETTITVKHGQLVEEIQPDSRRYYTFEGWYNGAVKFDFTTPITSDVTLTSKFVGEQFTITYKVQKGSAALESANYSVTTHTYGQDTVLPEAQSIEGYTFEGWYIDNIKVSTLEKDGYFDDIEVIGKYTLNSYIVIFEIDGTVLSTSTVNYGELVSEVAAPVKDGYNFIGWYLGEELFDFDTMVQGNITLQAKFEVIQENVSDDSIGCKGGLVINLMGLLTLAGVVILLRKKSESGYIKH